MLILRADMSDPACPARGTSCLAKGFWLRKVCRPPFPDDPVVQWINTSTRPPSPQATQDVQSRVFDRAHAPDGYGFPLCRPILGAHLIPRSSVVF